ncbi:MAG TPA: hypothetical protein VMS96_14085 [Terriglobales bacterium]|nr:hypothetical protein [Terriglobales bacterium]
MDPSFEQASHFLDQALLSYAGGQIEEAAENMASAAAILREIQPVFPALNLEPPAGEPLVIEFPAATAPGSSRAQSPPAIQRVSVESAREPSLAAAA